MTGDIETAVHYRYMEPLLATGRIPNSGEVAERLGVPVERVRCALRSLADSHGVVLHTHVCEPWVIHPFSASPTATWVESGNRGWWATCMWCACGVATLVGGDATIHTRIGGEGEDVDIHVEKGRVRESDLWVHFALPPRNAWDCVHHFCATVLPFRSPEDVRTWCDRHGIPMGAVAPIVQVMDLGREWYARHAYPDWRKWTVREAAEIFRKVGFVGDFWEIPTTEGGFDMPVAKIHVHEGAFRDSELATIGTAVQAALEEVLSVPPEDYFRITHVLPKGQFVHTPAFVGCTYSERLVLLELTFISGRPKDKRLALLAALNRLVVEKVGLRPDDLVVLIYEMPGENISFGQGLAQRAHISA